MTATPFRDIACALLATAFLLAIMSHVRALPADMLIVQMDEARVIKIPERAATVIVGNPLTADDSVQAGGLVVITGKGNGSTNVIALDREGGTLMEKSIVVRGAGDNLTLYRGMARETYSCKPTCERKIAVGDDNQYFNQTLSQSVTRATQAEGTRR